MADPLWVTTIHNLCGLACILGLTGPTQIKFEDFSHIASVTISLSFFFHWTMELQYRPQPGLSP